MFNNKRNMSGKALTFSLWQFTRAFHRNILPLEEKGEYAPITSWLSFGLKPIEAFQIYSCLVVWAVRGEVLWGGGAGWGSFSLCLIFRFSSWKCTPWAFDQSCEHQVSPHNLSLKAIIIIRSLRLSHRGNMRSAFIRQMEHGWSGAQWASGYNMEGLYEVCMDDR